MGIERIVITRLIDFWRSQNIPILTMNLQKIVERDNILNLPNDFKELYTGVNGMGNFYPNEIDEEGFLFYPVEAIVTVITEFENSSLINKDRIFIFAEYMHKSWWYGFEVISNNEYVIGIIPDDASFKPITNSLQEFIEFYLEDSDILYDYTEPGASLAKRTCV